MRRWKRYGFRRRWHDLGIAPSSTEARINSTPACGAVRRTGSDYVARLVFELSDLHGELVRSHLHPAQTGSRDYTLLPWGH